MSTNKKYWYMKLKDTFFDSDAMKILESQKNGTEYQNLYLKMCLLSLKNEGRLSFKDVIPYDIAMISTITRVNIDTVRTAVDIFRKLELIDIIDDGTMYVSDIQELIGHNSTEAERKATYRKAIKSGTLSQNSPMICPPEKEIELEKELEVKKERVPPSATTSGDTPSVKEVKHKIGTFNNVLITAKERDTLFTDFGREGAMEAVEYLSEYRERKGYKAKSDYLAIRKWVFDAVKEEKARKTKWQPFSPSLKVHQRTTSLDMEE